MVNAACNIIFDGRVPSSLRASDFDTNSSVYNDQFVHGANQTFGDIILFPNVDSSKFDVDVGAKAFEVVINDESIFSPGGTPQTGFRRSELLPAINDGSASDVTVQGTTTIHWSLRSDSSRPFNFSHEHQLVFHESADFSIDQFMLKTGAPFNQSYIESEHKTLRLQGSQTSNPETFFVTPFDDDVWHNFAVTVGWDSNKFTVYYSQGDSSLEVVNSTVNDNSGFGQQHWGILKLPTGDADIDVVHEGFQEAALNEGLVYGGIFIEDSTNDCLTV